MFERDVKLVPPLGFQLPDLDPLVEGLTTRVRDPTLVQRVYYDTVDLRLARAGAWLAYRDHEGWTARLPGLVAAAVFDRGEFHVAAGAGPPPEPATDILRAYLRAARPGVVARLRIRRQCRDLVDDDGTCHAEIVDDEVSVLDGHRVVSRFREIEIVITDVAAPDLANRLARILGRDGDVAPDATSTIVRALGPGGLAPPDVKPPSWVSPGSTAGEVIRGAFSDSVQRLMAHDAGVRRGDDPESVHQARVATRRLRSDLRTFRSLVDPIWATELRTELAWLADELGTVRDAEVLMDLLRPAATRAGARDEIGAGRVIARVEDLGRDRRASLLAAMRSPRYTWLLDRLVVAAGAPVFSTGADRSASETLPQLVSGPWRHLRAAVDALGDPPTDAGLHDVRIRAKRCRYAAEAVAPIVGKPARRFARRIAAIQDVLGRHHDAVMATEWLRDYATGSEPTDAYAAGTLAGMLRAGGERARAQWPDVWRAARRRKLRSWW